MSVSRVVGSGYGSGNEGPGDAAAASAGGSISGIGDCWNEVVMPVVRWCYRW